MSTLNLIFFSIWKKSQVSSSHPEATTDHGFCRNRPLLFALQSSESRYRFTLDYSANWRGNFVQKPQAVPPFLSVLETSDNFRLLKTARYPRLEALHTNLIDFTRKRKRHETKRKNTRGSMWTFWNSCRGPHIERVYTYVLSLMRGIWVYQKHVHTTQALEGSNKSPES